MQAAMSGRNTLIHMALDANLPILVIVGYGLAHYGNPVAVLLSAPWLLLTAVAFPVVLAVAELYDPRLSWWSPSVSFRIVLATLTVVALFGFAHFLFADRSATAGLFGLMAVAMASEVFLARSATALRERRARSVRHALVIGAGWAGRTVIDCTLREPRLRVAVCGFLDDDPLKKNVQYRGVAVLGTGESLGEMVARHGVSLVVTAISYTQNADLIKSLLALKMRGIEVVDMPIFFERSTGQIPIKNVEDAWFLYSGGFESLRRPYLQRFKRLVDLAGSCAGLVLAAPLMGIVALLVKVDSRGPVFHRQERTGLNEKPFSLITFRTMSEGAEGADGAAWAAARDCRVTRVGRWLRSTRLDEIPQFINVLKGEVSFIGPRPERPHLVERLKKEIPYYALRFSVKPGLTGWAQVEFRSRPSAEDAIEKLKYDLYYVKHMSLHLDLWVALKTVKIILFAQGT